VSCNANGIANVVAAEPFQFQTVSTIKEINYFRYKPDGGSGPGLGARIVEGRVGQDRPGKCAHTSALAFGKIHSVGKRERSGGLAIEEYTSLWKKSA